MTEPESLNAALTPLGLRALGHLPAPDDLASGGTLVLIGPDEPQFWDIFSTAPEYLDGDPAPLDRWSSRVLGDVAKGLNGRAFFPFGGPPYRPFFTWAQQSGQFWASPINFLVHAEVGLFVSFRGALLLPDVWPPALTPPKPCDTCAAPCLSACPVDAFSEGYDVAACKAHVRSPAGNDCRNNGCLARRACPVGQGLRRPEQAAFHMEAFL